MGTLRTAAIKTFCVYTIESELVIAIDVSAYVVCVPVSSSVREVLVVLALGGNLFCASVGAKAAIAYNKLIESSR